VPFFQQPLIYFMKNIFYLLPIVFAVLVACNNNPQPTKTEPAPEPVIVDSTHTTAIANKKPIIWTMEIEPNGIIMFGNKAISIISTKNPRRLVKSLLHSKSYFARYHGIHHQRRSINGHTW
jgi:hypothetical protein